MMHRVFVYGSLKVGFSNHDRFLSDSKLIGTRTTKHADYVMYSLGYFPYVTLGNGKIEGELYLVDDRTLYNLDVLEGNGTFYTRELVELDGETQPAWMYIIRESFREGSIDRNIYVEQKGSVSVYKWLNPLQ